jgi:multidrug efflux system membrane fusion protein
MIIFWIAMAGFVAGCSRGSEKPAPGRGKGMPVPVTIATAVQTNFAVQLQAIGAIRPHATVSVKPRVDGQLGQIGFKQGQEVKEGDLIFQIEPRAFEVALKQSEAVLARDVASLQNAEAEMRRTDELANTKAISASAVDVNRAKAASLRATVEADKAAVEIATVQLSYCSIRSPITGRMGLLLVDKGNVVKNGETILAVINQTRPIYADFSIPQRSLPEVREAMASGALAVEAQPPNDGTRPATGQLEVINNQVDSSTGTVLLRAVFPNPAETLWPGQFVNVVLTLRQMTNAITVPSAAVQSSQNGEFVYVVKPDSTVEKRPMVLGPVRGGQSVVQSGVSAGETVVTDGQLRLVPGSTVATKGLAPASRGNTNAPGGPRP